MPFAPLGSSDLIGRDEISSRRDSWWNGEWEKHISGKSGAFLRDPRGGLSAARFVLSVL